MPETDLLVVAATTTSAQKDNIEEARVLQKGKKGSNLPEGNDAECANCMSFHSKGGSALLTCTRCKAVCYCSKACQVQHWGKGGHKKFCVTVDERKPHAGQTGCSQLPEVPKGSACPICLEALRPNASMALPCAHVFHVKCVQELRRFGVQQACPLCRAALPAGPEQVFENSTRRYIKLARQQEKRASLAWQRMSDTDVIEMRSIIQLWEEAPAEGLVNSHFNLGYVYQTGQGLRQNFGESVKWYRKAVDQGCAEAQVNLAHLYLEGQGVRQSYKEAAKWYRKAADKGNAAAQSNLAGLYRDGLGVRRNYEEAAKWLRKAAEQDEAQAQ